jgi:hypothetical protein
MLILGSRLLILSTRPEVLTAIAPWVDVMTVNYYEIADTILEIAPSYPADYGIPFATMFDDLDTMNRLTGKPFLIGEFSYRAADSGLPNTLPPFFRRSRRRPTARRRWAPISAASSRGRTSSARTGSNTWTSPPPAASTARTRTSAS